LALMAKFGWDVAGAWIKKKRAKKVNHEMKDT
jgi:hypothetical protein